MTKILFFLLLRGFSILLVSLGWPVWELIISAFLPEPVLIRNPLIEQKHAPTIWNHPDSSWWVTLTFCITAGLILSIFIYRWVMYFIGDRLREKLEGTNPIRPLSRKIEGYFADFFPITLLYWIALKIKALLTHFRQTTTGAGGSGKFARFWKEWEYPYQRGGIYFGESLYGRLHLGDKSDQHGITIAGTGGGKGISFLINNLLLWPHNVICMDPKLENLERTGKNPIRHRVGVIDPFFKTTSFDEHRMMWNPLEEVDMTDPNCTVHIEAIVDAMIVPTSERDPYWDKCAGQAIAGYIAQVLTDPEFAGRRNLVSVYKLSQLPPEQAAILHEKMYANTDSHGLTQQGAIQITQPSGTAASNIRGTITAHLEWLKHPRIQDFLRGPSDFSIFHVTCRPLSLFLCLEGSHLVTFNRLVRMFYRMAFYAMENPKGPRTQQLLMLLDEFHSLGRFDILQKNMDYARSLGIKIWPVIQRIGQLQDLYGENWDAFTSGIVQVFSLNDLKTRKWISEELGAVRSMMTTQQREKRGFWKKDHLSDAQQFDRRPLLEPKDIELLLNRENGLSFVLPVSDDPLVVRRVNYDRLFDASMYSPDPKHPKTPKRCLGWTRTSFFGSDSVLLRPRFLDDDLIHWLWHCVPRAVSIIKQRLRTKIERTMNVEKAKALLGYLHSETIDTIYIAGNDTIQDRLYGWYKRNPWGYWALCGDFDGRGTLAHWNMHCASETLTEYVKDQWLARLDATWANDTPTTMTLEGALRTFGVSDPAEFLSTNSLHNLGFTARDSFRNARKTCQTLEQAHRLDQAYGVIYRNIMQDPDIRRLTRSEWSYWLMPITPVVMERLGMKPTSKPMEYYVEMFEKMMARYSGDNQILQRLYAPLGEPFSQDNIYKHTPPPLTPEETQHPIIATLYRFHHEWKHVGLLPGFRWPSESTVLNNMDYIAGNLHLTREWLRRKTRRENNFALEWPSAINRSPVWHWPIVKERMDELMWHCRGTKDNTPPSWIRYLHAPWNKLGFWRTFWAKRGKNWLFFKGAAHLLDVDLLGDPITPSELRERYQERLQTLESEPSLKRAFLAGELSVACEMLVHSGFVQGKEEASVDAEGAQKISPYVKKQFPNVVPSLQERLTKILARTPAVSIITPTEAKVSFNFNPDDYKTIKYFDVRARYAHWRENNPDTSEEIQGRMFWQFALLVYSLGDKAEPKDLQDSRLPHLMRVAAQQRQEKMTPRVLNMSSEDARGTLWFIDQESLTRERLQERYEGILLDGIHDTILPQVVRSYEILMALIEELLERPHDIAILAYKDRETRMGEIVAVDPRLIEATDEKEARERFGYTEAIDQIELRGRLEKLFKENPMALHNAIEMEFMTLGGEPGWAIGTENSMAEAMKEGSGDRSQHAAKSDIPLEKALNVFHFGPDEVPSQEELFRRYNAIQKLEIYEEMKELIDEAYDVVAAIATPSMTEKEARTVMKFGQQETFTRKELDDRYNQLTSETDSKTFQKELDDAYKVLLPIAI